jgi:hypothetical protein
VSRQQGIKQVEAGGAFSNHYALKIKFNDILACRCCCVWPWAHVTQNETQRMFMCCNAKVWGRNWSSSSLVFEIRNLYLPYAKKFRVLLWFATGKLDYSVSERRVKDCPNTIYRRRSATGCEDRSCHATRLRLYTYQKHRRCSKQSAYRWTVKKVKLSP